MDVKIAIFVVLMNFVSVAYTDYIPNIDCSPRPSFVAVDAPYFRYLPRMVQVHRCQGINSAIYKPENYKCEPKVNTSQKLQLDVFKGPNLLQNFYEMENHTSCKMNCQLNNTSCNSYETFQDKACYCKCNYNSTYGPTCPKNFVWDSTICNCACHNVIDNCGDKKVFSKDKCECQCSLQTCTNPDQVVNPETCSCVDKATLAKSTGIKDCGNTVPLHMLIAIVIAEALAFASVLVFFYVFCYKKKLAKLNKIENQTTIRGDPLKAVYHNGAHEDHV